MSEERLPETSHAAPAAADARPSATRTDLDLPPATAPDRALVAGALLPSAASGDFPPAAARAALHRAADLAADYLEQVADYPVLPRIAPGAVRAQLPASPPAAAESMEQVFADYKAIIEPNITHWNHPGFLAYFAITGSAPGIAAETLTAALNVNAMLWRSSPAATELEELVCDWLRQMLGLPSGPGGFLGHINDTASSSTFVALAVARHRATERFLPGAGVRELGLAGRPELPTLTVYASEHTHSSIDKAVLALGLGVANIRRIPTDAAFAMRPAALAAALAEDRAAGRLPVAVVATIGTTSSTAIDPVAAIAAICREHGVWLHVDSAQAGTAAIVPELRHLYAGWELGDSIVVNPHKWLFTPVDCSILFVRDVPEVKRAFSVVPAYLVTDEEVTNLMDLGFQLGRRFRSLKLWTVIRAFGVDGIAERLRTHLALAAELTGWIDTDPGFERLAPVPFTTVCFRALFPGLDAAAEDRANERVVAGVNAAGPVFMSPTKLDGRVALRITIGNLRTTRETIASAWELLRRETDRVRTALTD